MKLRKLEHVHKPQGDREEHNVTKVSRAGLWQMLYMVVYRDVKGNVKGRGENVHTIMVSLGATRALQGRSEEVTQLQHEL